MAGYATPTSSAGHPDGRVSAVHELTLQSDHSMGAGQSRKLAAIQELERKGTEIEIAVREKDKRIIEAEGIAKATEIISSRLTSAYLQYEAIKAQSTTINSPNHTTLYIPVGPMGVTLVGNLDLTSGAMSGQQK